MRPHDINKAIAEKESLDFHCEVSSGKERILLTQACAERFKTSFVFNPADDWSQAGPLIEKYLIHLYPSDDGGWHAKTCFGHQYTEGHPLRAAMRAVLGIPNDDEWPEPEEPDQCPGCGDQGVTIEGWLCDQCCEID